MEKQKRKEVTRDILIQIRVSEEENKKIEELAAKLKMNKSKLIRNIVLGEIEDGLLVNIGVLPIMQKAFAFYQKNFKGVDYWEEAQQDN